MKLIMVTEPNGIAVLTNDPDVIDMVAARKAGCVVREIETDTFSAVVHGCSAFELNHNGEADSEVIDLSQSGNMDVN